MFAAKGIQNSILLRGSPRNFRIGSRQRSTLSSKSKGGGGGGPVVKPSSPGAGKGRRKRAVSTPKLGKVDDGEVFGMRRVDYTKPPPVAPLLVPPPYRVGYSTFFYALTVVSSIAFAVYIYYNQDEDNIEFWQAVETGQIPPGMDDDDDDDDDDWFDDEFDDDEFELEEKGEAGQAR